jgi:hypothetical protein
MTLFRLATNLAKFQKSLKTTRMFEKFSKYLVYLGINAVLYQNLLDRQYSCPDALA